MSNRASLSAAMPSVYVTDGDFERLSQIVVAARDAVPGAAVLANELRRAILVEDNAAPIPFVALGSCVTYRDLSSGRERRVQIVLPRDASIDHGRVSVLTPIGAALIGMTVDTTFRWTDGMGRPRAVRVIAVDGR